MRKISKGYKTDVIGRLSDGLSQVLVKSSQLRWGKVLSRLYSLL